MNKINPFENKFWIPRGSNKFLSYVGPPLSESLDRKELKVFLKKIKLLGPYGITMMIIRIVVHGIRQCVIGKIMTQQLSIARIAKKDK